MRRLLALSLFIGLMALCHVGAQTLWVSNLSRPHVPTHGLEGRHLTLWASHGRYFDLKDSTWQWQRPPLFGTCEDLYTQTIVVPYLIPMLEKAGAVVFTPRERDWQRHEVIVDNDDALSLLGYREHTYHHPWTTCDSAGFATPDGPLKADENPFACGTARQAETTHSHTKQSLASYQPTLPEAGSYAVYVSYVTTPSSVTDAHYTVWHQGQKTEFAVNQRIGSSTWVYLGTFLFDAGSSEQNRVVLSNHSDHDGVVTTDAVRFGGGMGNIERGGAVSGLPRCLEGARYYAQWAGMPYSVWCSKGGESDYGDDINARSLMSNLLMGGSIYAPDSTGRGVPIELSLAVHSDAGFNPDGEGTYGTLAICTTQHGDSLLADGSSREESMVLAEQLLTNLPYDLSRQYKIDWAMRDLYDRNYSETRLPLVPSAILETMSHQHFGDMRYGQDPNFRFTLARSIYKTLLRYIAAKHNEQPIVSPLTPHHLRLQFTKQQDEVRMSWKPTVDSIEPTAQPTAYILYTAIDDGGFDNGTLLQGTEHLIRLQPSHLYSFRVSAVNNGGESFPSEVLCALYEPQAKRRAVIVNGFHRLSSPAIRYSESGMAVGFDLDDDPGVSYGRTAGWLGRQTGFDPRRMGRLDSLGLGFSTDELAGHFIEGNSFCYVREHAQAMQTSGLCSIVSCSADAFESGDYDLVDLILGLERNDGHSLEPYKAFTPQLQSQLREQAERGGALLVSGAYVGTDMQSPDEQQFLADVLKLRHDGMSRLQSESITGMGTNITFYRHLNEHHYAATSTDRLEALPPAFNAMAYADGTSAAVAYKGRQYSAFTMGFPLECIQQPQQRAAIMRGIMNYLINN